MDIITLLAFVLFIGMVVAWVVLPGTALVAPVQETTDPLSAAAVEQAV